MITPCLTAFHAGLPEKHNQSNYEKIFGTELPDIMDKIIKRVLQEKKFSDRTELMQYLRSKNNVNKAVFICELEKELPNWRENTSAEDPERYILYFKLPYRAKYFI